MILRRLKISIVYAVLIATSAARIIRLIILITIVKTETGSKLKTKDMANG